MKLVYIFMTTVIVLFSGKCVFAAEDQGAKLTKIEVKSALWAEGVVKFSEFEAPKGKEKAKVSYPEELTRAIELERRNLYKLK